jgi:dihydroorotate dehydrogenase electron transfer subunit
MGKKKFFTGKVVSQESAGPKAYVLTVRAPAVAKTIHPGQFVMLRCWRGFSPLLNRPFGLFDKDPARGTFSMLYKVRGPATEKMSRLRAGFPVTLCGPLGNGFDVGALAGYETILLCAGGIGIGPLHALAKKLRATSRRQEIILLFGAQTKKELLCIKEFHAMNVSVLTATDDGSQGYKGFVSDRAMAWLKEARRRRDSLAACVCGPRPMLKNFVSIFNACRIPAYVALEEHFACGIGACFGCAVKIKSTGGFEYARICHDGPVFSAEKLILE